MKKFIMLFMKWIFADVDGTIFDEKSIISNELKADIKYARSIGFKFIIATGNPMFSKMKWLVKELDIRFSIVSNGAGIYDSLNNKFIYKSLIPFNKIMQILKIAKKLNIFCDYWDDKHIYISSYSHKSNFHTLMNFTIKNNGDSDIVQLFDENKHVDAFKIEIYSEKEKTIAFYNKLMELKLDLHIAYINDNHIEITNINVNKKTGIDEFLRIYGGDIKDSMTIGDSSNDYEMLLYSNYSYAMGQSPENIKKAAKFLTRDINDNGLGYAIRDYINRINNKTL